MSNQHPITPPPELVGQWSETIYQQTEQDDERDLYIANQAARWGADQELEACVNYIDNNMSGNKAREFRAIRRPKPPSLKEQALEVVTGLEKRWDLQCDLTLLRRALEALPND